MTFASVYEVLTPISTVRKTKFWDWFDGDAIRNWWLVSFTISDGSSGMNDVVNEGAFLTTGTTIQSGKFLEAGGVRHYSHTASKFIGIIQAENTTNNETAIGGNTEATGGPNNNFAMVGVFSSISTTDFVILTGGGTVTGTAATFSLDTNFHTHLLENTSSNNIYFIDGGLEVTKSTNRPTLKLQSIVWQKTRTSSAKTGNIRYFEAYST